MKVVFIVFSLIFATLLAVFTFTDVILAQALYHESSGYARFIHQAGHVPAYFLLFLALAVLLKYVWLRQRQFKRLLTVGLVIAIVAAIVLFMATVWTYFSSPVFAVSLLTIVMVASAWISALSFPDRNRRYREYATIYAVTFFIVYFLVAVIKFVWVRERFMYVEDPSSIVPWFQSQGWFDNRQEFTSMPSGHMTSAAMMIIFIIAARELRELPRTRVIISLAVGLWLSAVGFGRVVGGYHYPSDLVLSSALVVFTMTLVRFHLASIVAWLKKRLERILEPD